MNLPNLVYLRKYNRATEEKADWRLLFQEELQSVTELLN